MFKNNLQQLNKLKNSLNNFFLSEEEYELREIARKITDKHLSYLGLDALYELTQVAVANEKLHLEGAIIETGCALGGSSIALASVKNKQRKLFIYDAFGMIPPPSKEDEQDVHERYQVISTGQSSGISGETYYGYIDNLYDKVVNNFFSFGIDIVENNIHLVKGFYEDTLKVDFPVALAHIDCDWFDSVWISLQRIEPYLVSGGTLIIDDYYAYSGCKKAVDKYFQDKKYFKFVDKSRLHIIKE